MPAALLAYAAADFLCFHFADITRLSYFQRVRRWCRRHAMVLLMRALPYEALLSFWLVTRAYVDFADVMPRMPTMLPAAADRFYDWWFSSLFLPCFRFIDADDIFFSPLSVSSSLLMLMLITFSSLDAISSFDTRFMVASFLCYAASSILSISLCRFALADFFDFRDASSESRWPSAFRQRAAMPPLILMPRSAAPCCAPLLRAVITLRDAMRVCLAAAFLHIDFSFMIFAAFFSWFSDAATTGADFISLLMIIDLLTPLMLSDFIAILLDDAMMAFRLIALFWFLLFSRCLWFSFYAFAAFRHIHRLLMPPDACHAFMLMMIADYLFSCHVMMISWWLLFFYATLLSFWFSLLLLIDYFMPLSLIIFFAAFSIAAFDFPFRWLFRCIRLFLWLLSIFLLSIADLLILWCYDVIIYFRWFISFSSPFYFSALFSPPFRRFRFDFFRWCSLIDAFSMIHAHHSFLPPPPPLSFSATHLLLPTSSFFLHDDGC